MRMWGTDLSKMCNAHMLGEHRELHMMVGALQSQQGPRSACLYCKWIGDTDLTVAVVTEAKVLQACPLCGGETRNAQLMSLKGHCESGMVKVSEIKSRHDSIVAEMRKRGMPSGFAHDTPIDSLPPYDGPDGWLDLAANEQTLRDRCERCKY